MKPNPKYDRILMFFYAVHDVADIPGEEEMLCTQRINRGIIYINDGDTDIMRKAGIIPTGNQNLVPVSNEAELMDKIIELVWEFDPEILVGFETERSSWGYLFERAFNLKHKLWNGLGRLSQTSEKKNMAWQNNFESDFKISELHCDGRIILNLWILLKYETLQSNVTVSPNGVVFVRPQVEKGIISKMVEEILNTRIMIKKSMKIHAKNKALCKLLDSRQLGLKLIANVTFGYTAASFSGRMPCVEVGDSIVRKSRETLEETVKLVNSGGPNRIAKSDSQGGWDGCRVIYGDTDSVFILMPKRTKNEAFILGSRIADAVTALNPYPVKLKFEKVYMPCLLEARKRYVGLSYETPDQIEPKFDAKGIETVRRDNCGIVSKMLERTLIRLFSTDGADSVKQYVTKELNKILRGEVNLIDFIIAKEYRGRHHYKPGSAIPAMKIAREMTKRDSRAEPLAGERVPYIIIQGAPGDTLISCVRRPEDILFNTNHFNAYATNIRMLNEQKCKLSLTYYITKQILPPLNRALSLVKMDVFKWYAQLPKRSNVIGLRNRVQPTNNLLNRTISSYFQSQHCLLCQSIIRTHTNVAEDSFAAVLCANCIGKGKQHIYFSAIGQLKDIEDGRKSLLEQCYGCTNTVPTFKGIGPLCVSKDCEIFFDRVRSFQQPTEDLEELLNSKAFNL